jgi:hypothetical protein
MYELLALHTVVPISKHGRRFDEQSATCVVTRVSAVQASSSSTSAFRVSVSIAMLKYRMVAVRPARRDL